MAELLKKVNNKNNGNEKSATPPEPESLKIDGKHPLEYMAAAIHFWLKKNSARRLPISDPRQCAYWWMTKMQPCVAVADDPLLELIMQRQYLLRFLNLDSEDRELITEAAELRFYYRGDDLALFRKAYLSLRSGFPELIDAECRAGRPLHDPRKRDGGLDG